MERTRAKVLESFHYNFITRSLSLRFCSAFDHLKQDIYSINKGSFFWEIVLENLPFMHLCWHHRLPRKSPQLRAAWKEARKEFVRMLAPGLINLLLSLLVLGISPVIVHSSASPKLVLSTASPTPTTGASTGSSTTTSPDAGEGPYCGQGLTCGPYCQLLCLNMHNYYRDLHGSPPLECDQELATSAQEWTDQQAAKGYMHHSEWTDKFTESISWKGWGWEGMDKMEGAIAGAVRGWYSEIKNGYNYQTGRGTGVIGHFQAVVWAGETRLGCGLNIKPNDGTYVTAHYAPPSHTSMEKEKIAPDNVKPRRSPEPGCNIPSSGRELCRPDLTAPFVNPGNCPLECCYDDMFMGERSVKFYSRKGRTWCFKRQ